MSSISRLICNVILPRTNNANCVRAIRCDCGGPRLLILEARNYVSDANELIKSADRSEKYNVPLFHFQFAIKRKKNFEEFSYFRSRNISIYGFSFRALFATQRFEVVRINTFASNRWKSRMLPVVVA